MAVHELDDIQNMIVSMMTKDPLCRWDDALRMSELAAEIASAGTELCHREGHAVPPVPPRPEPGHQYDHLHTMRPHVVALLGTLPTPPMIVDHGVGRNPERVAR